MLTLLLLLLFALMIAYFCYSVYFYGGRWVSNPHNPRISSRKQQVIMGTLSDRDGTVLAYTDESGRVIYYHHHDTWHDDNGSSHIKAALLSPFIVVPFVNGRITVGPWQNLTLVECDTRDRTRDVVFQVMGE